MKTFFYTSIILGYLSVIAYYLSTYARWFFCDNILDYKKCEQYFEEPLTIVFYIFSALAIFVICYIGQLFYRTDIEFKRKVKFFLWPLSILLLLDLWLFIEESNTHGGFININFSGGIFNIILFLFFNILIAIIYTKILKLSLSWRNISLSIAKVILIYVLLYFNLGALEWYRLHDYKIADSAVELGNEELCEEIWNPIDEIACVNEAKRLPSDLNSILQGIKYRGDVNMCKYIDDKIQRDECVEYIEHKSNLGFHVQDNKVLFVYSDEEKVKEVEDVDLSTFSVVGVLDYFYYAKDQHFVYVGDRYGSILKVSNVEVDTFRLTEEGFLRDNEHVYTNIYIDMNPRVFELVKIKDADPDSFIELKNRYAKDKYRIYYMDSYVEPFIVDGDLDSFQINEDFRSQHQYDAMDINNKFKRGKLI